MAGDWIKLERATPHKPEMIMIARIMKVTLQEAFWEWVKFYFWLDEQCEDGFLPHLVRMECGHLSGVCPEFIRAMSDPRVGWLVEEEGGCRIKNWERHNGTSAKRRATDADRKKEARQMSAKCPQNVRTESGPEKRREEKSKEGERQMPLPPPQEGKNGSKPKVFIRELAVVREGIVEEMKRLKARGCSETANGVGWTDERCKVEYAALLQRRKALDEEMRKAAGV